MGKSRLPYKTDPAIPDCVQNKERTWKYLRRRQDHESLNTIGDPSSAQNGMFAIGWRRSLFVSWQALGIRVESAESPTAPKVPASISTYSFSTMSTGYAQYNLRRPWLYASHIVEVVQTLFR